MPRQLNDLVAFLTFCGVDVQHARWVESRPKQQDLRLLVHS